MGLVGTQSLEMLWVPMAPPQGLEPWISALPTRYEYLDYIIFYWPTPDGQARLCPEAEWEFAARGGLDGAVLANYWRGVFPRRSPSGSE